MATYKLTYFNLPALGETSRLILVATGTAFDDHRLALSFADGKPVFPAEFAELKAAGKLPFGQVPTLEVSGAAPIAQSKAIERYLARELGIAGASSLEAARLDSVCEEVADIKSKFNAAKGDAEKRAAFLKADLPTMYGYIDAQLAAVSSAKVTIADIYLYQLCGTFSKNDAAELLAAATPGVKAAVAKVAAIPAIAAWEAGRPDRKEAM